MLPTMNNEPQSTRPHILVTNDDGVHAPGLLMLAQTLRRLGDVSIIAPDRDWSGSGRIKTLHHPLRVRDVRLDDGTMALASDGAPSDCVALAALGLLDRDIDLVVSGINTMANLGHDVTCSGTVAAVMEGVVSGIPGVAVSLDGGGLQTLDFNLAAHVAEFIVADVLANGLPEGTFLNVNVPHITADDFAGIRLTRQGTRVYHDRLDERQDPRGRRYYWISGAAPTGIPDAGTDIGALAANCAAVTPLTMNLWAADMMETLTRRSWVTVSMPDYHPSRNGAAVPAD